MEQPREPDDPVAFVCRNLKKWRIRAAGADWESALERVAAAAAAGTMTSAELAGLREVIYSSWLDDNEEELRAEAVDEGSLAELEAELSTIRAGGSAYQTLRKLGVDLEDTEQNRRPFSPGSAGNFPQSGLAGSDFVCPRTTARCGRREPRGPGGWWPRCALGGDSRLKPVAARPGRR